MMKVDVLQVLISTYGIVGLGLIWMSFTKKVFKTVYRLASAPKDDSSCESSDVEERYRSDECSEALPQIPEPPPFYIS